MHYYIDGYNLMFRFGNAVDDFAMQRHELIVDLNMMAKTLDLEITIVFDAQYQADPTVRTHFQHLEIIFSAHGETADDLILDEIKTQKHPHQTTVVTSDKKLAWFARRCSAKTESVGQFLEWVEKRYKNKLKHKQEEKKIVPKKTVPSKKSKLPRTAQETEKYYLEQFEKRLEELPQEKPPHIAVEREETKKQKGKPSQSSMSDKERWLQIFERRLGG